MKSCQDGTVAVKNTIMNTKRNVWLMPVMAVILFGIGLAGMVYVDLGTISKLHTSLGTNYTVLSKLTALVQEVDNLSDGLLDAQGGEDSGLEALAEKAKRISEQLQSLSAEPGQDALANRLKEEFDLWYRPAMQARMTRALRPNDPSSAIILFEEHYRVLENDLEQARLDALNEFASGATSSAGGSRRTTLLVVVAAVLLVLVFGVTVWMAVSSQRDQSGEGSVAAAPQDGQAQNQRRVLAELNTLYHSLGEVVAQVKLAVSTKRQAAAQESNRSPHVRLVSSGLSDSWMVAQTNNSELTRRPL